MLIDAIAVTVHRIAARRLHLSPSDARRRAVREALEKLGLAVTIVLAMLLIALVFTPVR